MFEVVNFKELQHYKDRTPPWIKLYNKVLDNYEFGKLPDASKAHLILIWLLASRSNNKLPFDPEWIGGRINASEAVDLELLSRVGLLRKLPNENNDCSKPLAPCKQDARPERERETEKEIDTPLSPPRRKVLPEDCPTADDILKAEAYWKQQGVFDRVRTQAVVDTFCSHHKSKATRFKDWSSGWRTWYVREAGYAAERKPQSSGPELQEFKSRKQA